jgi:hypothetical protein
MIDAIQAEAERLALLSPEDQRHAIRIIRAPADDPRLSDADREEARNRADALKRILTRLNRKKKKE